MAETPRRLADDYVEGVVALDPVAATALGLPDGRDRMPDLSPAGEEAMADLERRTLAELDAMERSAGGVGGFEPGERRCARLLRERLTASLALSEGEEHLRSLGTLNAPVQSVRSVFTLMPQVTADDWAAVEARLRGVAGALAGYRESLAEGMARRLETGPAQAVAVVDQLGAWLGEPGGLPWFSSLVAAGPEDARERLEDAAAAANAAVAEFRHWLRDVYAPWSARTGRDPVGRERYARFARYWTGSDLDLDEAYDWGWSEFARIDAELRAEAGKVLPGAEPAAAMRYLDEHGDVVDGVDGVRARLQAMMDEAIEALDGVHFDLAGPVRIVQAMIAPPGSAAAPYYTRPAVDFSRPGRTWLPTLGRTRFPMWELISTWYHEGVPGHHLQLAQWVLVAPQLSRYQASLGSVGANVEGWALYAERLMDELGFFRDSGARLGYLDAQRMRAIRVIIDIGMHLELKLPAEQGTPEPFAPGETWTPALARDFFGANCGRSAEFIDSELIRYLGMPGQAISYKLGERAWLAGREAARAARAARGETFDVRAWHMAALSGGSLGLDDLVTELSAL